VSTRRLIALALACGLAILVAGGMWLFLASRQGDEASGLLQVGVSADVEGIEASVVGWQLDAGDRLLLDVTMTAGSDAVGDPGRSWRVVSSRGLVDRPEDQSAASVPCLGRDLAAGEALACTVVFAPTVEQADADLAASFVHAGGQASWDLTPPPAAG
jgi:hypothetical protein